MSDTNHGLDDPYRVKGGDTLSAIAKRCGRTLAELSRFNRIANSNQLKVDQTIYLSERSSFSVSVQFLDALRQPIANLPYQLRFDGKVVSNTTGIYGTAPRQITRDAQSPFEVWIQNPEQPSQRLASTVSGYGHKLITLVSGSVVIKGQTQTHPQGAPTTPVAAAKPAPNPAQAAQPPVPKPATGTPSKNNKAVKTKTAKAAQGQSIIQISVEFPKDLMTYFDNYKGGETTEKDWNDTAKRLECEPAVLKAIAQVESGGKNSFWRLNKIDGAYIPFIQYERQIFSRRTKHKFDATHTDISWPAGFHASGDLGKDDKRMPGGTKVEKTDLYGPYEKAYLRLINAYRLDADAALNACSWCKFQVLGESYATCGATNLDAFLTAMCTSELKQIDLMAGFIQRKPAGWIDRKDHKLGKKISLWDAVKTKDWPMIAYYYNGETYKKFFYDTKLKTAYAHYA